MLKPLAVLAAATVLSATALAQPARPPAPPPGRERGPEAIFNRIDTNHDGRVTWEEVWAHVQARFTEADTNRDGALSLAEMQAARPWDGPDGGRPRHPDGGAAAGHRTEGGPRPERRAELTAALFRALDANRDGQVTLEEIRPAAEARFRALDANGDNAITRDELPRRPARPPAAPPPAR